MAAKKIPFPKYSGTCVSLFSGDLDRNIDPEVAVYGVFQALSLYSFEYEQKPPQRVFVYDSPPITPARMSLAAFHKYFRIVKEF